MQNLVTKTGTKMKPAVSQKIIEVMTDPKNDGMKQYEIAEKVGVSVRTLCNYLTDELWEHIRALRLNVMKDTLADVDRAVFAKAVKGDISAAKMIYARWDQMNEGEKTLQPTKQKTLEEIEEEIAEIQAEIGKLP